MTSKTLVQTTLRPLTGLGFSIVLMVNLLTTSTSTAQLLEMADLIAHPALYDRKEVVVMGKVTRIESVIDKEGQPAFRFLLEEGVATVRVTSRTEVQEGEQVIVEGTFSRRRQAGRIKIYNEVNANSVRPLNEFNPDLVG